MSKLDKVIERIRQLPAERQEALAAELEFLLEGVNDDALTDEQWALVEQRMAGPRMDDIAHELIVAEFEEKYGR